MYYALGMKNDCIINLSLGNINIYCKLLLEKDDFYLVAYITIYKYQIN